MLEYLSLDIICSAKPRPQCSLSYTQYPLETVRFSEQIMSADKIMSIFPCQMKVKSAYEPTVASVLELIPVSIA